MKNNQNNLRKSRFWKNIVGVLLLLLALAAYAATFTFSPNPDGTIYNLSEDTLFFYDLNVSVDESLVQFSSDAQDIGFTSFRINNVSGIINFTPFNNDVNVHYVTIIAQNRSNPLDKVTITLGFNVSNTNDPPNITGHNPNATNVSVAENSTLVFNYTATDDDLIHGEALNNSWYLDSVLQSINTTWNFTPTLCSAGIHNVTLVVNDSANANATINWNVTVNNTNRIPVLNQTFYNLSWPEDTNKTNNLTLTEFFRDDDALQCTDEINKDNLTFSVQGNQSIIVRINQSSGNASFLVPPNFFGSETIIFSVYDGTNTTRGNNITLNISNINDPPVFNYSNQTLFENITFVYDLNATDPDNEIQAGINNLTYYTNSSFFSINASSGVINFTPNASHLGVHPINLSVDDGIANTSSIIFFNISPNSAPSLAFIGNRNATESIFFVINITATEPDSENVTFASNYSRLNITAINASAANISFLPTNTDVGNHTVNITARDTHGATAYEIILLSVYNLNEAPNLTAIPNQTMRTDKQFTLFVTAIDPDNDNLTFLDNATFFNLTKLNLSTALINFTPTENDTGNHTINISVTDGEFQNSLLIIFSINNNSAPNITALASGFVFTEDQLFTLQINATDADNDTLLFYANTTFFNLTAFNATSALINFTPTQNETGLHWINISANDTPLRDYRVILFNITVRNDSPYITPAIPTLNATVSVALYYDINATDEENDALIFADNASFFNISNSTGIISFTPQVGDVGNYSVNISVTDGLGSNVSTILFRVVPASRAPNITSAIPNESNISVAEGSALIFNITAADPDGDTLSYSWRFNGTVRNTSAVWSYEPTYTEAGLYNVTVSISDAENTVTQSWNLTVNNTNRPPRYGIINESLHADFISGISSSVNLTAQSGNITLEKVDGVRYFSSGNFTSQAINILRQSQSSANVTFQNISWTENRPQNTSITFFLQSSPDNVSYTNFTSSQTINYTSPNGTQINLSGDKYLQYRAVLSTNLSNTTPVIEEVFLTYKISDFYGQEDTVYTTYIDLDNYFYDPDTDNTMTYTVTNVSGISITIDNSNRVSLTPDSDFAGTRIVSFTANDGSASVSSNNISITFIDVAEPAGNTVTVVSSSSSGGGGGGGGAAVIFQEKTVIVNQTKAFELIVPETIQTGTNKEIIVPITLQNLQSFPLSGISIEAKTNLSDISYALTQTQVNRLEAHQKTNLELIIEPLKKPQDFIIRLTAKVTEPDLNDSAVVSINVLGNISQEINYVRDFMRLNPECLELNELVVKAEEELAQGNYGTAQALLENAIDRCKYILTGKKIGTDTPETPSLFKRYAFLFNPYLKYIGIALGAIMLIGFASMIYNRWKWA